MRADRRDLLTRCDVVAGPKVRGRPGQAEIGMNLLPRVPLCETSAHAARLTAIPGFDQLVQYMFSCHIRDMDDDHRPVPRHERLFDVEQALRKARKLWPRKHVPGDYNPFIPVAAAIVEHLESCRISCFRRSPGERHAIPGGPPDTDRNKSGTEP